MYDYIIIGAGSAGCVLANRLSANPTLRVLLLEAGPRDWNPFIHMPAGLAKLVNFRSVNWDYDTEPVPSLDNRQLWWPRGKVLGGSSSINAMCFIRGNPADYDEWATLGARGWDWQSVLPYFKRSQNQERGGDAWHGVGGPLNVADLRYKNPLSQVFLDAAAECGYPLNRDFNGASQQGFGDYQVTQKDGFRCSTAAGYLKAARGRANLQVLTGGRAERIVLDQGRAVAVNYVHRGRRVRAEAAGEILLAGGALNSPQLLMLSGIGAAEQLTPHGIEVAQHLPGVGQALQDHLDACTMYRATQPITYDRTSDVLIALEFLTRRRGIGTSNIAESGGFVVSKLAQDTRPDIQFHFVPALLDDHGRKRLPGYGMTLHACALRPRSRGYLTLASADPTAKVRIHPGYLSDAEGHDLATLIEGVRLSRQIFGARAFAPFAGAEMAPGSGAQSDAEIAAFIRSKAESIYHPVGTCAMGDGEAAVVDAELKVRGIAGLRVVDASVMPKLIGGNTNAPTVMIAEKASDLILRGAVSAARNAIAPPAPNPESASG